jgi:hypothetical protein
MPAPWNADQSAPSLQAKAADVRATRSSAIAAGRLPDPKLAFGVERFPISGSNAGHPARGIVAKVAFQTPLFSAIAVALLLAVLVVCWTA